MPFENTNGGTVITGERSIALARLISINVRLKCEAKGLKFRGGSTFALVKREFHFKGNKESVLAQYTEMLKRRMQEYTANQVKDPTI